jgi:hypothetical protein
MDFLYPSSYISLGKIFVLKNCERLKLFIEFAQPVDKNFKKLFKQKSLIFVHHHNLITAYQM